MDGQYVLNGFEFDYELIFHDDVEAMAQVDLDPVIEHWQCDLGLDFEAVLTEFVCQAGFVGAF